MGGQEIGMNEDYVQVTRGYVMRVRSFAGRIAALCETCVRRSEENCARCDAVHAAKNLVRETDALIKNGAERADGYKFLSFCRQAINDIRFARRAIGAAEIHFVCTRTERQHFLERAVLAGVLTRTPNGATYLFDIGPTGRKM